MRNPKQEMGAYCSAGAVDDGNQIDINHFAPCFFMFIEGRCTGQDTGVVDADVEPPEDFLVTGERGSELI
jgi:hypothetical protein